MNDATDPGRLDGRVAVVTGGARGIGLAIARDLVARGAKLVIADNGTAINGEGVDPAVAEQAAAELGESARAFTPGISSPAEAAQAVALALEVFGGIDIVINNAAILRDGFIFKADPADWDCVIATNLAVPYYLLNAATPIMREQAKARRGGTPYGWGRIVNITSSAGVYGNLGQSAYASAKAGLVGLTRVAAMDLGRAGITANAVAPFAHTRVTETIEPANEAQASYKARALKLDPRHVATVIAWLCSSAAQDISGQLFGVRGREVFLFSQARTAEALVRRDADWDVAGLAEAAKAFVPHFTDLTTDLEAFDTEPVV